MFVRCAGLRSVAASVVILLLLFSGCGGGSSPAAAAKTRSEACDSVEEAHELANEVISQIVWRVGPEPIDLEAGEEIDEVGFGIVDLGHGAEPPGD
jgi:hypothetical protein